MIEKESSNPPDFETIYGEPNPDEEVNDNFTMEQSEDILKFEKKLAEIMTNAKNIDFIFTTLNNDSFYLNIS